jgi:hypothetical protein
MPGSTLARGHDCGLPAKLFNRRENHNALATTDDIISNLEPFHSCQSFSIHTLRGESELGGEFNM